MEKYKEQQRKIEEGTSDTYHHQQALGQVIESTARMRAVRVTSMGLAQFG